MSRHLQRENRRASDGSARAFDEDVIVSFFRRSLREMVVSYGFKWLHVGLHRARGRRLATLQGRNSNLSGLRDARGDPATPAVDIVDKFRAFAHNEPNATKCGCAGADLAYRMPAKVYSQQELQRGSAALPWNRGHRCRA